MPNPGLIHRPDSLTAQDISAVTRVGDESPDRAETSPIWAAAEHWYAGGLQPAIQVCVRHCGDVVVDRSIGHGRSLLEPVTTSTPFCLYSASKLIAAVAVWRLVEQGRLRWSDRVADLIPGYGARGKATTTLDHVMTHRAGIPFALGGTADRSRADDRAFVRDALRRMPAMHRPGLMHFYHALTWGPVVREIVEVAAERPMREYIADEITGPLGLRWTTIGVTPQDVSKVAPSHVTGPRVGIPVDTAFRLSTGRTLTGIVDDSNTAEFLTSTVPSSSGVSNATELSALAETLLRGGERNGVRILSEETIVAARRQRRVLRPDVATAGMPLRWGTGVMLGSHYFGPFGRRAPEAFGHTGLTQIAMWADPQRDLAVAIVSSGKPLGDVGGRYRGLIDTIAAAFGRHN
ncbi:serine hydrolase domain-containing protein [Gordonia sp. (in: high G+C Gram-positive bacteria)]|uniref:serine hydrolase domain-containing protein n=1 Tax=Gordonia sp. (in: high G+C Gram-positive bacteria) TaxID=84139 RepID=UPI003F9C9899